MPGSPRHTSSSDPLLSSLPSPPTWLQHLRVWCKSLAAPSTPGFGAKAAAMLAPYASLRALLDSVAAIRTMHTAISTSAPPLQVRW